MIKGIPNSQPETDEDRKPPANAFSTTSVLSYQQLLKRRQLLSSPNQQLNPENEPFTTARGDYKSSRP